MEVSKRRLGGIRLIQIRAFVAVVDRQSFGEAAEELGCDQSTVSRYVDDLGSLMGAPLLHFGTALPSAAGNVFLPAAREVIDTIDKSKAKISALLASPSSPIRGRDLKL